MYEQIVRSEFVNEFPFAELGEHLAVALDWGFDDASTKRLQLQLREFFGLAGQPLGIQFDDERDVVFDKKLFCFSGKFDAGSKQFCHDLTEALGGQIKDSVVKNLNYLVVGKYSSPDWLTNRYGTKIRDAMSLNKDRKGAGRVLIISEMHWLQAVLSRKDSAS